MFCPNCGTQNDSAATPCKKCGFKLSGISASKFKGTMMLNTDQTVHELIEEHKKKQSPAEGGAGSIPSEAPLTAEPEAPLPRKASQPPLSGLPGAPKSVLAPPRAAVSKRRMGGTMLGVAPPAGGVTPQSAEVTATPPQVNAPGIPSIEPPAAPSEPAVAPSELPSPPVAPHAPPLTAAAPTPRKPADPLAGTVGMPVIRVEPVQPTPLVSAPHGTRPLAAVAEPTPRGLVPGGTRPLAAAAEPTPWSTDPAAPREVPPESLVPTPRVPAVTVPQQPAVPAAAIADSAAIADPGPIDETPPVVARGVRPFEVVLIVATCGLYGLVLLVRQRKTP